MTPAECDPDAEDVDSTTLMEEDGSTAEYVVKTHADALHRQLAKVRALAEELDQPDPPEWMNETEWGPSQIARRLREALGERP